MEVLLFFPLDARGSLKWREGTWAQSQEFSTLSEVMATG